MISLSFTIEVIIAVIIMIIMHISMISTNGAFLKNVIIYSTLSTIIIIILGLRGIGNILFMWIIYCIEGLPMVWIMRKLYDTVSFKFFVITLTICWFIIKFIFSFFNGA